MGKESDTTVCFIIHISDTRFCKFSNLKLQTLSLSPHSPVLISSSPSYPPAPHFFFLNVIIVDLRTSCTLLGQGRKFFFLPSSGMLPLAFAFPFFLCHYCSLPGSSESILFFLRTNTLVYSRSLFCLFEWRIPTATPKTIREKGKGAQQKKNPKLDGNTLFRKTYDNKQVNSCWMGYFVDKRKQN